MLFIVLLLTLGIVSYLCVKLLHKQVHKINTRFSTIRISEIVYHIQNFMPKTYGKMIDTELLKRVGVEFHKPIWILKLEELTLNDFKNFYLASLIQPCTFIIFYKFYNELLDDYKKFGFNNIKFYEQHAISPKLKESLYLLDIGSGEKINRLESHKINLSKHLNIYSIDNAQNESILLSSSLKYKDCFFYQEFKNEKVKLNVKYTFFDAKYYFFRSSSNTKIKLYLPLNLKNFDYVIHEKINSKMIKITSVLSNNIWQIKSSNTINKCQLLKQDNLRWIIALDVVIKKDEELHVFISNNAENVDFLESRLKNKYNLRINSQDAKLDFYINHFLPRQIILDGLNDNQIDGEELLSQFGFNEIIKNYKQKRISAQTCYELLCRKIIIFLENGGVYLPNSNLGHYELKFFINNQYKTFKVTSSDRNVFVVNGTKYVNCNVVSNMLLLNQNHFEIMRKVNK